MGWGGKDGMRNMGRCVKQSQASLDGGGKSGEVLFVFFCLFDLVSGWKRRGEQDETGLDRIVRIDR